MSENTYEEFEKRMAKKFIPINSCSECPSRDHRGAFGRIAYIPICRATGKELPYDVVTNPISGISSASATYEIPEWCPLEDK